MTVDGGCTISSSSTVATLLVFDHLDFAFAFVVGTFGYFSGGARRMYATSSGGLRSGWYK